MKLRPVIAISVIVLGSIGCANKSDETTGASTTSVVAAAISTARAKIANAVPSTSGVSTSSVESLSSISGNWTSSSYAIGGDFGNSPRNSIRAHGDSTTQSSLMYRFKQNMDNLCNFTTALPKTGTTLTLTGNNTLTLTAAVKASIGTACSTTISGIPDDTVIGYKVEDISANAGTNYDRKVSFDVDGNSTYTQFNGFFYYRISGTLTRMAFVEDSTNDSVALFEYDSSTGIARFEFSEFASSFKLHYRVLLLETSDLGYFTAYVTNNTDSMQAVVGTKEGGGTEIAVSYTFVDDGPNDITDGNACVNSTTFAIATDNTLTCSGVTGSAASSYTASHTGITSAYITGLTETAIIRFTDASTLLTAVPAN